MAFNDMAFTFNIYAATGCPLARQRFTWRELVQSPISKLNDDAFTRVRILLMNSIEHGAIRFQHMAACRRDELRLPLARVRRSEQHQATLINGLLGPDHSPLETTIGHEQMAIEVGAAIALREPDGYLAQIYRFGLLEDFDHLYRFSALLDRIEGKDANHILQSYTDILPGRPTMQSHRAPEDDLRAPHLDAGAALLSKLHALTLEAAKYQTRDYYMTIGALFSDQVARQLYAEIASVEEQHATEYGALQDPAASWLAQWLLHEANEVYHYHGCVQQETNSHVKGIWERFLDYELGHFHLVAELFKQYERRDPAEVVPAVLPAPVELKSHREFVRQILMHEIDLRARGARFVDKAGDSAASRHYRDQLNRDGSPSESVAAGCAWTPNMEWKRTALPVD